MRLHNLSKLIKKIKWQQKIIIINVRKQFSRQYNHQKQNFEGDIKTKKLVYDKFPEWTFCFQGNFTLR